MEMFSSHARHHREAQQTMITIVMILVEAALFGNPNNEHIALYCAERKNKPIRTLFYLLMIVYVYAFI